MPKIDIETDWGDDPLETLKECIEFDHIDEFWDYFGALRCVDRSARPGEWGYFMIVQDVQDNEVDYEISFQLPVDADGNMSGPARLVLNTQAEIIEEITLDWELTQSVYAEISEEIKDTKHFATPDTEGRDFYDADYGVWLKRMTNEDRQLHLASA